jgi:hypothetical protein
LPIGIGTGLAIGAGVAGVGAVAGGLIQAGAAKSAAKTTAAAADKSLGVQQQEFDATTANNKPFLTTGTSALNQLAGLYGLDTVDANGNTVKGSGTSQNIDPNATFYQTPDYNFALSQGIKGVDAGDTARGMLDSGATRKAEIAYAGNLASGQFNSYADRLRQIAGIGQGAANSQQNANSNYANTFTNTTMGAAQDQANATLAGASGINNSIQQLIGAAQYGLGKNPFGSSYAGQIQQNANNASVGSYFNGSGSLG